MAKIHEEIGEIKLSKLVKDSSAPGKIANEEIVASLIAVVEELVGADVVVEVVGS